MRPSEDPLLALRALACFMVLFGHYFVTIFSVVPGPSVNAALRWGHVLLQSSQNSGVWIFFTLSGYLMGKGFTSGRYLPDGAGIRRFYQNRLLRIVPMFYGAILIVTVLTDAKAIFPKELWSLIQIAAFDFRNDSTLLGVAPLWSVCTEVQFYLLVPFLFLGLNGLRRVRPNWFWPGIWLLCVCCTAFRLYATTLHHLYPLGVGVPGLYGNVYASTLANIDMFLLGMSLNFVNDVSGRFRRMGSWVWLVAIASLLLSVSVLATHLSAIGLYSHDTFLAFGPALAYVPTALFIVCADKAYRPALRRGPTKLLLRFFMWTGTLSYALYIFHFAVFSGIRSMLPPHLVTLSRQVESFPFALVAVYAVSAFFYFMVERPFERKKSLPEAPLLTAP